MTNGPGPPPLRASIDLSTACSIAIVAYCLTNFVHEELGHGGAALLVGAKLRVANAIYLQADDDGMTAAALRIVKAGGSGANLVFAALAYGGLRLVRRPGLMHYFLWLMLSLNVLMPFGYLMFSGLSGFGDWAIFVEGLGPPPALRALLIVVGIGLYFFVAPRIIMPGLNEYLSRDPAQRSVRAKVLALYPYIAGGTTFLLAGLFNPFGWKFVLLSAAAASFGGTSLLAWYPEGSAKEWARTAREPPAGLARSVGWMVVAAVVGAIFVGVLGPGLSLRRG